MLFPNRIEIFPTDYFLLYYQGQVDELHIVNTTMHGGRISDAKGSSYSLVSLHMWATGALAPPSKFYIITVARILVYH
jgi:hypothetical protein